MGFDDTIRSGLATAARITASLQSAVTHRRWTGQARDGKPAFDDATVSCVVSFERRLVRRNDGQDSVSRATLTFLAPLAAQGADGRKEPVDERDRFVLPDGTTGVVLVARGVADPATGFPYVQEIFLGDKGAT